jgi:hypothetical protein
MNLKSSLSRINMRYFHTPPYSKKYILFSLDPPIKLVMHYTKLTTSSSCYYGSFDLLKYSVKDIRFLSILIDEGPDTNSKLRVIKVHALTVFEITSGKLSVTVSK